jgi:hypothetical protein
MILLLLLLTPIYVDVVFLNTCTDLWNPIPSVLECLRQCSNGCMDELWATKIAGLWLRVKHVTILLRSHGSNHLTTIGQYLILFFYWYSGGGVQLGPLGTAATNRPIVQAPGDYDDGEIGGMIIGRVNRSTRRKPSPVPLCPSQPPHALPGREPRPTRWEVSD